MADHVRLFEVGPRDGLQNEPTQITTSDKIRVVDMLSDCGFDAIEVTSFVSPQWVPQLADAAEVMAGIERRPGTRYGVLTPNLRGFEAARAAKADEVAIFAAASESFSQKNINCSIEQSFERFRPILEAADGDGIRVRGYVSCVTDCPYEGPVNPHAVAQVAQSLLDMGCYEVSLGDTIGAATPGSTGAMLEAVLAVAPAAKLAGHFHDTNGRALTNIDVCLDNGLRVLDAAVGGLGGCPYAPGAKGNVGSEAVVAHLRKLGFDTGIDEDRLAKAAEFVRTLVAPAAKA